MRRLITFSGGDNLVIDESNPFGTPLQINPIKNVKILGKTATELIFARVVITVLWKISLVIPLTIR